MGSSCVAPSLGRSWPSTQWGGGAAWPVGLPALPAGQVVEGPHGLAGSRCSNARIAVSILKHSLHRGPELDTRRLTVVGSNMDQLTVRESRAGHDSLARTCAQQTLQRLSEVHAARTVEDAGALN